MSLVAIHRSCCRCRWFRVPIAIQQFYGKLFFMKSPLSHFYHGLLADRMVFALNKVDLVYPGQKDWHPLANLPSPEQERNIQGRIRDVQQKIREALPSWHGTVIGYSANNYYNLPQLFSVMLDAVPQQRQWVLASRKALADFMERVDPQLLSSVEKEVPIRRKPITPVQISFLTTGIWCCAVRLREEGGIRDRLDWVNGKNQYQRMETPP